LTAQLDGALDSWTDFLRVKDQCPIEPALLVLETDTKRLHPRQGPIVGAFLFGERPRGRRANDQRAIRRLARQITLIEQRLR
jgi:hypothetical protein